MKNWIDIITKEQYEWVMEMTKDKDIIFMSVHGSWLYGLEREGSDVDIKAIYAPTENDLLLGEGVKTWNKSNKELDIEIEVKSLPSFLRSARSCDTNCIDLLYTPKELTLITSNMWGTISSHRENLLAKNMKGIIGYIKVHSSKYGNKITRFKEMNQLLEQLSFLSGQCKLKATTIPEWIDKQNFKYIKTVMVKTDHEQHYIDVCGKKYILTWESRLLEEALETEIKKFGDRTKKGNESGMDFKSLSHAIRVLCQLEELLTTGGLKFPLLDSNYILRVKTGQVTDKQSVMDCITEQYDKCMELIEISDFPEEVDISPMLEALHGYYF
tara:strand:- start:9257 stop:10237 length:981 start_codon:yes stop_codon:yes gene_type:complete